MASTRYAFRVEGRLSAAAGEAFADMRIVETPDETALVGEIVDEAHLHGVIAHLQTLGLTVVSVQPVRE